MDEVRVWNAALTQAQIRSNMNLALTGYEPNLVVYYRCDEGRGTRLNDSAPASPNLNATLNNHVKFVPSGLTHGAQPDAARHDIATTITNGSPGEAKHALSFDGLDGSAQGSTNGFPSVTNTFTVELWARPDGLRQVTAECDEGISGFKRQRYAIFPDHGDHSYGAGHAGAGLSVGMNGVSVYEHAAEYLPSVLVYSNSLLGWTHLALVYSNRLPRLYVNGTLVRTGRPSAKAFVHAGANLGGTVEGIGYGNYQGQLDEVRVWSAALTQTQIRSNMNLALTGHEPNLVVYYRCDEGRGTRLFDAAPASPNLNATLNNHVKFVPSGIAPFAPPGGPH